MKEEVKALFQQYATSQKIDQYGIGALNVLLNQVISLLPKEEAKNGEQGE